MTEPTDRPVTACALCGVKLVAPEIESEHVTCWDCERVLERAKQLNMIGPPRVGEPNTSRPSLQETIALLGEIHVTLLRHANSLTVQTGCNPDRPIGKEAKP